MDDTVPKPHTPLAVSCGRLPTEREILELADQASYVFGLSEAAGLRERLRQEAEVYRDWLEYKDFQEAEAINAALGVDEKGYKRVAYNVEGQSAVRDPTVLRFLLLLIFHCPQILSRPAGFDWVLEDLEKVLLARRLDPKSDRIFWKVMKEVQRKFNKGRPSSKGLDYFRYGAIIQLMKPSVVIPGVMQIGKTKAVEFVAEMESRIFNGAGNTRSIWRSYERVEQSLRQLSERMWSEPSLAPSPTNQLNGESEVPVEKTSNRRKHSTRPKRVRRK